jgi:HEAT repeat protein
MANETITKLGVDVERVLVAGAHLAAGDTGLARDKEAIEKMVAQLGAKAPPVLSRLAEQVGKATTAPPKEQPAELLNLAVTIAQVRAAQAQPAAAQGEAELAAAPEVVTPCNAKDLYALHDALVTKGSGRMEVIRAAIERDDTADLRLVHAAVQAMGDTYGELADAVATEIVPKFGAAIVEPVLSKLRFPGRTIDARRMKALIAVEKEQAKPLIERALQEGSPDMRQAALDGMATWLPGVPEYEPIVLAVLEKERAGDVRRAAVRALKGYSSDASLQALLDALDNAVTLWAAGEALGGSKNPHAVDRMLERLAKAIAGMKSKGKEKGDSEKEAKIASTLLEALGEFKDDRIVGASKELIGRPKMAALGAAAAQAMLKSANESDLQFVADLLKGDDEEYFAPAVKAARLLAPNETFERLITPFQAHDRNTKAGQARMSAIVKSEFVPSGDAWAKALLAVLKDVAKEGQKAKSPGETLAHVIWMLGRTKDPRATQPLIDMLETHKDSERVVGALAHAFEELGDVRAVPALLERLRHRKAAAWRIYRSIERLADESTVDKVREIAAETNDYTAKYLLRRLEEKFPGA